MRTSDSLVLPRRRRRTLVVGLLLLAGAAASAPLAADDPKKEKESKPSLTLKASPAISFSPARITVRAELKGGSDTNPDLYCPTLEWEWGDQTYSESVTDCGPFEPGKSEITRRWTQTHTFQNGGTFRVQLRLKRAGKVVLAGQTSVQVKPGVRDLGVYDE